MKHIFYIYNVASIEKERMDEFIINLSNELKEWGYTLYNDGIQDLYEIAIIVIGKDNVPIHYETYSVIVLTDDSICHNEAPFGSGNDLWNIKGHVDAIIIADKNPVYTQFSIRTPLFVLKKLNYERLVAALINQNS